MKRVLVTHSHCLQSLPPNHLIGIVSGFFGLTRNTAKLCECSRQYQ